MDMKNGGVVALSKRVKTDFEIWFLGFLIFCFIGWLYEVLIFYFELGYGFVNRGFLFGPWLPVYGVGGIAIILFINPLKKCEIKIGRISLTPIICFLAIITLCTFVELCTSYIMESVTGGWLWDYTNDGLNYQGRIALKSSIRFGVIGMLGLYAIWPFLNKLFLWLKNKNARVFGIVALFPIAMFMIDVVSRFFIGGNYVGP